MMRSKYKITHVSFRGATEVAPDPVLFRWEASCGGYIWRRGADGKLRLFEKEPTSGAWRYKPPSDLFKTFGSLKPTRIAIQNFAAEYGDLFSRWDIETTIVRNGKMQGGTSFERWKIHIADMQMMLQLWEKIRVPRRQNELSQIITKNELGIYYRDHLLPFADLSAIKKDDLILPAKAGLHWELNRRLADFDGPAYTVPRLSFAPDWGSRVTIGSVNLLGHLWMQFALAVAGQSSIRSCVICGELFQSGPGAKRSDTQTCTARCRKRKSRRAALGV